MDKIELLDQTTSKMSYKKYVSVFLPMTSDSRGLHVLVRMVCKKTQGFILVTVESPYVQFTAARVSCINL